MPANLISMLYFKVSTLRENFVRFHAIESEIGLSKNFRKNEIAAPPTDPKFIVVISTDVQFVKIFCAFIY